MSKATRDTPRSSGKQNSISASNIAAAEAALERVLPMTYPADSVLSRFFREHPQLGQQERAFVAETLFGILRHRYSLEYHTSATTPRHLLLAYLNRVQGLSLRQLEPALKRSDTRWLAAPENSSGGMPPLHVAAELPQWLVEKLRSAWSDDDILALGRALQEPAPLDLRVNTLLATRDEVLNELAKSNINGQPTPHSPLGIRLTDKPALHRHPLFLSGKVEVQDEGSQLLAFLLAPKRREMVVDFCAGAGGKTLALGALMQSTGRLYAFDVSDTRLNKLKPRLKRSQLSNVHPQLLNNENDIKVKRLAGKIARVLVDAPCSGFGTLRRNPDLKWRQTEESVAQLASKQGKILNAASQLLAPGGRVVYATCSFLREENQDVVSAFLAMNSNFELLPANEILREQHIPLDTGEFLQLYPQRHGCDGFFAAVMKRAN